MIRSGSLIVAGVALTLVVLALAGAFDGEESDDGGPLGTGTGGAGDNGERVNRIYDAARESVVFIQARVQSGGRSPFGPDPRGGVATGSGFLFDGDGHVVTNAHVVEEARQVAIQTGDGLVPAKVVGLDLSTDLAVLKVDPDALDSRPLRLAESAEVEVGDPVVAMGNPLGLEDTITAGIVSALQRRISAPNGFTIEDVIQSDAAINPGNSGGPLLDLDGRVIGVNSQIATAGQGRGFIGIGFAVGSDTVERIVPTLIEDGKVRRPYLGVSTVELTPERARRLGLTADSGALVLTVAEGSPAAQAGIRGASVGSFGAVAPGGDVIVSLGGEAIRSPEDLASAVAKTEIGERVEVGIVRDGRRRQVALRVGDRPG